MIFGTLSAGGLSIFSFQTGSIKTLITGILTYAVYTISRANEGSTEEMLNQITPHNNIFVFDVHGVVFKLSILEIIKVVIKDPSNLWIITMMLRPMLCVHLLRSQMSGGVAEEIIYNVAKEKPHLAWFVPKAFKLINAQVPIKPTVKILKKLKNKGYKLYILSNIGEKSLMYIEERHPEVFKMFDGIYTSSDKDGYIKKPQPEIYQKYLDRFGQNPDKLIFIDDKKSNLSAAKKFGIDTIHFTSAKKLFKILSKRKAF